MSDSHSSSDHSYSGETMPTWYWTDAGRERAQREAIEEQRARTRRLDRERRAGEAKLAEKISTTASQMHSRLDTVLRWTELRFQLLEFDEYQARKEIRNTVRALAGGRMPVLRAVDDVPGYWLPPAAAAVLPLVVRDRFPGQGTGGNAFADLQSGLETARERDAVRTELFSLAVGRCFDQPAFTDAAALRLLSEPADLGAAEPGQVARGWRTLWEQAATGALGPGAEAQIASLLRERFDPAALDEAALAEWDRAIEQFGPSRAESFTALEAHFAAALGTGDRPDRVDAPSGGASSDSASSGSASPGSAPPNSPLSSNGLSDSASSDDALPSSALKSDAAPEAAGAAAGDPLRLGASASALGDGRPADALRLGEATTASASATDALRLRESTPGSGATDDPADTVGALGVTRQDTAPGNGDTAPAPGDGHPADALRLGGAATAHAGASATDALRLGATPPSIGAVDNPASTVGALELTRQDAAFGAGDTESGRADAPRRHSDDAAPESNNHIAPSIDDTVWRSYLQELIEEPSAAELPLVGEMAALNPSDAAREEERRSWTDPVGTVADLVRRDLFDPEAPIPLRRLALGLTAPVLRERLDRIEASLGTTRKAVVTVRRRGAFIEVTRDGHDPDQLAAVERRIDRAFDAAYPSKPLSYGIALALGLLAVVTAVLGQWFVAVLCGIGAIIPLWKYRGDAAKARQNHHRRDEQLAETRAALVKARKDAENQERSETENGLATRRGLTRLRDSLPGQTTPDPRTAALDAPA